MSKPKYAKAKDCVCDVDPLVKMGLVPACMPCTKLRHRKAVV